MVIVGGDHQGKPMAVPETALPITYYVGVNAQQLLIKVHIDDVQIYRIKQLPIAVST